MRGRSLLAGVLVATLVFFSASARNAQAVGGDGGTPFSIKCASDQYLRALYVREGARINQLGIRCEKYGKQTPNPQKPPIKVGGDGGTLRSYDVRWTESLKMVEAWTGKCTKNTVRVCALTFGFRWVVGEVKRPPWYESTQWWPWRGWTFGETRGCTGTVFVRCYNTTKHTLDAGGQEIYGFSGRAGNEIDNINILTRPIRYNRPRPPA